MPPSKSDRFAQIRALRAAGKTGFDDYQVEEAESIYETVDDEGYKKVVRSRLDQDDFVVDDNGEGYADDGREDWQDERQARDESDSEEELPRNSKAAKRKRVDDADRADKLNKGISKYFNQKPSNAPKSKPVRTAEDDEFMAGLLGEVDTNIPSRVPSYGKPLKSNDRRKTRVLSPPLEGEERIAQRARKAGKEQVAELPAPDDYLIPHNDDDDDTIMSDPLPSSPAVKAVERKEQAIKGEEPEEEDLMEIAEVTGNAKLKNASVNIRGSRPVPKLAKPVYPTPSSSSPVRAPADDVDMTAINRVTDNLSILSSPVAESAKVGKMDSNDAIEDDGSLRFFWMDYTEVNGSLCLFGKVKSRKDGSFASAFVKVDNILRKLYFLPREFRQKRGRDTEEEVEFKDVYEEQFVLWKNIMGPCWLKIDNADFNAVNNASWCKLELAVSKPNDIVTLGDSDNLEAPPLTLMSLAIRTVFNQKENKNEILVASVRFYENISLADTTPAEKIPSRLFTIMRPHGEWPIGFKTEAEKANHSIRLERNELGVLSMLLAIIQKHDPDAIMGHRLDDVDFGILMSRMRERKTPGWHRIGRLKRNDWPKNVGKGGGSFFAERHLAAGRLLCDLGNDMGKSMMTNCQSWTLDEMVSLYLNGFRKEIDNEKALAMASSKEGLMNYVKMCEVDTYYIAALALKTQLLPLTKVLTNLAGNSWARTLSGTRAERNEYILLHEFYRNKYICPDKVFGKGASNKKLEENGDGDGEEGGADAKKKDKYKGGLVFEPEKGLYDKFILVMDFNSLYPSIIQEYNICFTTVDRSQITEEDDKVPDVPDDTQNKGILPRLIKTLVSRRREVKKLMKDKSATEDQLRTWDGREILQSTKDLAESAHALRVIYGDTDSVMVNTNMGKEFQKSVNERYELLEIEIDHIFRRLLLHAKKKYAAIQMVQVDDTVWKEKLDVKGLDMRRREYCQLSKDTSTYLRSLGEKMRNNEIAKHKYTIYTQLGKHPKDYPNGGHMPSVQVALKRLAKGKQVKAKDVMAFVICGNNAGNNESAAKNAYELDEVMAKDSELVPDIDYYLHKQILPPVERLCAPIDGTNVSLLAECLGLDTTKYRVSSASKSTEQSNEITTLESQIPDHIRFKDCEALGLLCLGCKNHFEYRGLNYSQTSDETPLTPVGVLTNDGLACPRSECKKRITTLAMSAQLETQIRRHTARYYSAWLVCDDPACGMRTRQMSVYGHRCLGPRGLAHGCSGRMAFEYSEKALYNQLLFLQGLFDVDKSVEKMSSGMKIEGDGEKREKVKILAGMNRDRFAVCWDVVKAYLDRSGWGWVSMDALFGFAMKGLV
ncbi:related to DNA polymerase alpha catalytic subunit [Ramularia collo-cygni]|uniref:DNA polymerase n=1 Tax=Ramularia collo-cygni TaxID=112498 RepID=A0A2D3V0U6_9PEZI|nr:related to DNA polymerase alpha catalytic subunit [Ramularia collo-cygni]CZT16094.1 related to DNA polymerase alpha catalytic subunit [Ramularia collo-cygni]